ncbi:MAG: gluconokinase [Deltaproteobacteria bacterium]|nr:gluconokinase [Deltaproteobacteria bacterium]
MSGIEPTQAQAPFVLSLDIGTSSIRAALFDAGGRLVKGSLCRRPHQLQVESDGRSETNPDDLLDLIWACIDELIGRVGSLAEKITALASCSFVSNLLGLDRDRRAVTPLMTYADTRSSRHVQQLRSDLDETAIHQRTGCRLHTSYWPAQLLWHQTENPDLFKKVKHWVSLGDYLELKLFGTSRVSTSVASWTGLLNRQSLGWDETLLASLGLDPQKLSGLVDASQPVSGLKQTFAARWPQLAKASYFPTIGDGAAANLGSQCASAARVAITIGTSAAVRTVLSRNPEPLPRELWCYRVDRKQALLGGALSEGGNVFAWLKQVLRLPADPELEKQLLTRQPSSHGLNVLPFLAGERSPGWQAQAQASIHGLSAATTSVDILHAFLEAVALRIGLVFEPLKIWLTEQPQLVANGGALLNSPAWMQILADVLGHDLYASKAIQASARGAALLALQSLGHIEDIAKLTDQFGRKFEPNRQHQAYYQQALSKQKQLYEKMVTT